METDRNPAVLTHFEPAIEAATALTIQQLTYDILTGRVPADTPDYSTLHDYVDANEYGLGPIEKAVEAERWNMAEDKFDAFIDCVNESQQRVDRTLREGFVRRLTTFVYSG